MNVPSAPAWSWSSDIAHHVTITKSQVAVVRWDTPADPVILNRPSVEKSLDDFYRFLSNDRVQSSRSVVFHLLSLFRKVRSLSADAGIPDGHSSEVFLLVLARLIFGDSFKLGKNDWGIGHRAEEYADLLNVRGLSTAIGQVSGGASSTNSLQLFPALAVRHAGGLLFQEAHFELLRAPSLDFFGHIGAPELNEVGRGGAHFTPPALARSLVEQSLSKVPNLDSRETLTVCDPACGSGVFLHEVLRALRRRSFAGKLILVGYDISPIAVSMAKFVLNCAAIDWKPFGGLTISIEARDSLEGRIEEADLFVMNHLSFLGGLRPRGKGLS